MEGISSTAGSARAWAATAGRICSASACEIRIMPTSSRARKPLPRGKRESEGHGAPAAGGPAGRDTLLGPMPRALLAARAQTLPALSPPGTLRPPEPRARLGPPQTAHCGLTRAPQGALRHPEH